jgi:hypothetical protein
MRGSNQRQVLMLSTLTPEQLVPADHPQRRRLAATRRPEQHDVLAVIDVQVDVVDSDRTVGELLRQVDQVKAGPRRKALCVRGGGGCRPL